jgi:hypothetical protein
MQVSRSKEQWIEKTGGFRPGESDAQFQARVAKIERLNGALAAGRVKSTEIEAVQRQLCELKGIRFDNPD